LIASGLAALSAHLQEQGFRTEQHQHSLNATPSGSDLRIQFTTHERYQPFPMRSRKMEVLGVPGVQVACLEDITQGKLWAYGDPRRRLSKRKKDELDLIRLAEAYPHLKSLYPAALRDQIARG
jgi:hypothetical protein